MTLLLQGISITSNNPNMVLFFSHEPVRKRMMNYHHTFVLLHFTHLFHFAFDACEWELLRSIYIMWFKSYTSSSPYLALTFSTLLTKVQGQRCGHRDILHVSTFTDVCISCTSPVEYWFHTPSLFSLYVSSSGAHRAGNCCADKWRHVFRPCLISVTKNYFWHMCHLVFL